MMVAFARLAATWKLETGAHHNCRRVYAVVQQWLFVYGHITDSVTIALLSIAEWYVMVGKKFGDMQGTKLGRGTAI